MYRKPTHTQICTCSGTATITCQPSLCVINTLRHRIRTVCSNNQLLKDEEDHLNRALSNCKYPRWALNRANFTIKQKNRTNKYNKNSNTENKPYIVVPHMKGLSESCRNICSRHGIEMYFKGTNTIREHLVHPKDKDNMHKKSKVIYRYKCDRVDCEDEYIGESGKTFTEGFREHMKSPSHIHDHCNTPGHKVSLDNFSIVGREDQNMARTIKETMLIRVNDPSLNRNIGNTSCHIYGMRCWSSHQN